MPFKSKSQLRTCYSRRPKGWDCDKFLQETKSICNLPEKVGYRTKTRSQRSGEKIVGKIQTGPRGGRFFTIREQDDKGEICSIKVYLKR